MPGCRVALCVRDDALCKYSVYLFHFNFLRPLVVNKDVQNHGGLMLTRDIDIGILSVRLSRSGNVLKRLNLYLYSSKMIATKQTKNKFIIILYSAYSSPVILAFPVLNTRVKFRRGHLLRGVNTGEVYNIAILTNIWLYVENDTR